MMRSKHDPKSALNESSMLLGGLSKLENKQNLNNQEIKQMIELLKAYESLCIKREDFSIADSVKNKIEQLRAQQIMRKQESIAIREKQNMEVICQQADVEIRQFQEKWDRQIEDIVEEMKQVQQQCINQQQNQLAQYTVEVENEPPPKIKYSSKMLEKRKYLSNLIRVRNYKAAEEVKQVLKNLQRQQETKWLQKHQQQQKTKIQRLQKKQYGQLQVLRVKLEALFNEKVKQRDRKFQILLKKNRKRRVESNKASRQRLRSRNKGVLEEISLKSSLNHSVSNF